MDDTDPAAPWGGFPPEDACLLTPDSLAALETLLGRSVACRLLGGGYYDGRIQCSNLLLTGIAPVSILGHRPWPGVTEPVALWLRVEDTPDTPAFTVRRLTVSPGVPLHRTLGRDLDAVDELPLFSVATHLDGIAFLRGIEVYASVRNVEPQDAREPRLRYDYDARLDFHYENPFRKTRFRVEVVHPDAPGLVVSSAAASADAALPDDALHPDASLRTSLHLDAARADALWAFTKSRPG